MAFINLSPIELIDEALFATGAGKPSLSYKDPTQKSIIRDHLTDLLTTYSSSLSVSVDTYHNPFNGTNQLLFKATLLLRALLPPPARDIVPITVWIHQDYPYISPVVLVTPDLDPTRHYPTAAIPHDHPLVDPSTGSATTSYLRSWRYPKSNLCGLVNSLIKAFSHHPLVIPRFRQAEELAPHVDYDDLIDQLSARVQRDVTTVAEAEIESLMAIQGELARRRYRLAAGLDAVVGERARLERRVAELRVQGDELEKWVRVSGVKLLGLERDGLDGVVGPVEERSRWLVEWLAEERGVEDSMYALDKALEEGVVGLEVYMRQVRSLGREQFLIRARLVKFWGPNVLDWPGTVG